MNPLEQIVNDIAATNPEFARNGDFKRGDIKEFMGSFCKPGRATHIRKSSTAAERRADALGVYMGRVLQ